MKPKKPKHLRNLEKRGDTYHLRITIKGRPVWKTLETGDAKLAAQRARALRDKLRAGQWDILLQIGRPKTYATIGDILTAYAAYASTRDIRARTAKNNANALLKILRDVHGETFAAKSARSTVLTADLLRDYQAGKIAAAKPSGPLAIESAKTSAHSTVQQARSIFAKRCLQSAEYEALHLPDLAGFLAYSLERGKQRGFRAPETAVIEATAAAAAKLRQEHPARWLAFMLAANLGLRRSEGVAARWDWVREIRVKDDATAYIMEVIKREDFDPKGSERIINIHPDVWQEMLALRSSIATILPGPKTVRLNLYKENVAWLRSLGWTAKKPTHELRKYFGATVATEHSLYASQSALGHSDPRLTSQVYAAYLNHESVVRVF